MQSFNNKKVMVVSESLGPINGVTRATGYLLDYLLDQGIETAVLAPNLCGPNQVDNWQGRLPVIRLNGYPLVFNPELAVVKPFRMSKVFNSTFTPDVIYMASPASTGFQVWWQLRKSGIPLVANFQTDLAYYARLMLPKPIGKLASWGLDRLTSHTFRHPSIKTVLAPSHNSEKYLIDLGIPSEKIRLVGRGVDSNFFNNSKRNSQLRQKLAPNGELLLLCVSRLSLEKGFEFLAEAYEEILRRSLNAQSLPPLKLVITGGNANPNIERSIKGYFQSKHLNVHFTGPLSGEPLAEIFASADLFLFPSLTETYGQVIQEAMASGLPVIARSEGGPVDLVIHGKTGFLSDPHSKTEFVEYALELIKDHNLRRNFGHTARTLIESRSWDTINYQIAQILEEALLQKEEVKTLL
ncbi:glycosyltransferase family 1 protein [Candidatus Chlorohelix sp.]|uniref:glycosyltransferase family 4 protein n=1 Tax=Candidatus Chlorohelix sp. TaxID=3139201 RepID=UPI0030451340